MFSSSGLPSHVIRTNQIRSTSQSSLYIEEDEDLKSSTPFICSILESSSEYPALLDFHQKFSCLLDEDDSAESNQSLSHKMITNNTVSFSKLSDTYAHCYQCEICSPLRLASTLQYLSNEQVRNIQAINDSSSHNKIRKYKWELRYNELVVFINQNSHCNVPRSYPPNKALGKWVNCQRTQYARMISGKPSQLTSERVKKLEDVGFKWSSGYSKDMDALWHKRYRELTDYSNKFGNCDVPKRYSSNIQLGQWVANQRRQYKNKLEEKSSCMTDTRIRKLQSIGFKWCCR